MELRTRKNRKWRAAERQLVGNMEKDSITVENLLPNTEYQFRVRSVESAAIGEPSIPSDWVKTAPGAPSETIDNLKWRSLDSQTLLVEWQPIEIGQESSGDNLRYRVSWSEATVGKNATDDMKLSNQDDDFENHLGIQLKKFISNIQKITFRFRSTTSNFEVEHHRGLQDGCAGRSASQ